MGLLVRLASWSGLVLVAGFVGVVLWRFADGTIDVSGMLDDDSRDTGDAGSSSSWARAQAMVVSLFAAALYLKQVAQDPTHFPDVPAVLVGAVGASHVLYLGGKLRFALTAGRRSRSKEERP